MLSQPRIRTRRYAKGCPTRAYSSDHTDAPFLAVMVLPVWDDSPWTSNAIRGHPNMSTLIRIPTGHVRFVPANKQTDDASIELKPVKWPVDLILIANDKGRESYLDNDRVQAILAHAIQAVCKLRQEETICIPPTLHPRPTTALRALACPTRPLPHSPAITTRLPLAGPLTPPQGAGRNLLSR